MDLNDEEILNAQQELLQKLDRLAGQPGKKILELGGGKGYFAVAAAKQGYEVTVIELMDVAAHYIRQLAEEQNVNEQLTIINGDFYTAEIPGVFDVLCYWDGLGIGSDADQQKLLNRIQDWLKPCGIALIDIYTPWFWSKAAGRKMHLAENVVRKYGFDAMGCRIFKIEEGVVNSENEDIAILKAEYTENNSEALTEETITIFINETGGVTSRDYEGLPEDGVLEFDFPTLTY